MSQPDGLVRTRLPRAYVPISSRHAIFAVRSPTIVRGDISSPLMISIHASLRIVIRLEVSFLCNVWVFLLLSTRKRPLCYRSLADTKTAQRLVQSNCYVHLPRWQPFPQAITGRSSAAVILAYAFLCYRYWLPCVTVSSRTNG